MGGMKDQIDDLFDYVAPSSRVYQETSRQAWRSMVRVGAELDRLILAEIEKAGDDGIVCADIEANIGRSHQAVSGNLRHLVEKQFVEDSGKIGKKGR